MIKQFDKTNLKNVRTDINAILATYAKKNGIELSIGNISFTSGTFTSKINAKVIGAETPVDHVLTSVLAAHNLKTVGADGRVMTKYNTRGKLYPFVYSHAGKSYKCSLSTAKIYFA